MTSRQNWWRRWSPRKLIRDHRERTHIAHTFWAEYAAAVVKNGSPHPGCPSSRELRRVYGLRWKDIG